jgi:hypothetical protein
MSLNKPCTGWKCENKDRCPHYIKDAANPFLYISPLSTNEECPYWPPTSMSWGEGAEPND